MEAPPAPAEPPIPWNFIVVTIVIAVAIAIVLGYLGLTGHLGAGVTGEKSPSGGVVVLSLLGYARFSPHSRRTRRAR